MTGRYVKGISAVLLLVGSGCAEYTSKPQSFVLPTSNRSIDTVLHRSDVRFLDCGTLAVIQTFDVEGRLIDAQAARGTALHCGVIQATIEAGGRVGAAAVTARAASKATAAAANAVTVTNGQYQTGSAPTSEGQGGGNNGGGNGSDDGTNGGTDNHHDNGDNN